MYTAALGGLVRAPCTASQRDLDQAVPQVSAPALRRAARVHPPGRDPDQHGQREGGQEEAAQQP